MATIIPIPFSLVSNANAPGLVSRSVHDDSAVSASGKASNIAVRSIADMVCLHVGLNCATCGRYVEFGHTWDAPPGGAEPHAYLGHRGPDPLGHPVVFHELPACSAVLDEHPISLYWRSIAHLRELPAALRAAYVIHAIGPGHTQMALDAQAFINNLGLEVPVMVSTPQPIMNIVGTAEAVEETLQLARRARSAVWMRNMDEEQ